MGTASVSVVIPCHNRSDFLPRAIESALAQTLPAQEVIVVDDHSTDDSVAVASRYPVRLITSEVNRGAPGSRNAGIRAAQGAFYACLDSDDWWAPDHLETVLGLFERFPEAVAAGAMVRLVGDWPGGERDGGPRIPALRLVDAFETAFRACPLPHQTLVCRMDAVRQVGGYDESIRSVDDFDLYLRLSRLGPFVRADKVTAYYRAHPNQLTTTQTRVVRERFTARYKALQAAPDVDRPGLRRRLARLWDEEMLQAWYRRDGGCGGALLELARERGARRGLRPVAWRVLWRVAALGK